MNEVEIVTPRGVVLRGTFTKPAGSSDGAVLFSHAFLCDRLSSPHFSILAEEYHRLGYATLIFDYSGHGASDDDPITTELRVEDLRAASGWLSDQGFDRQLLHAHSSGSVSALRSRPRAVQAVFLSSPIVGPMDYDWEQIFSASQLEELEKNHSTRVMEDGPTKRLFLHVTQQTLLDLALNDPEDLFDGLETPVLILCDRTDAERGVAEGAQETLDLLPPDSHIEIVTDRDFSVEEDLEALWGFAKQWAEKHVPLQGERSA